MVGVFLSWDWGLPSSHSRDKTVLLTRIGSITPWAAAILRQESEAESFVAVMQNLSTPGPHKTCQCDLVSWAYAAFGDLASFR